METLAYLYTNSLIVKLYFCMLLLIICGFFFINKECLIKCYYYLKGIKLRIHLNSSPLIETVPVGVFYTGTEKSFKKHFNYALDKQEMILGVAVKSRYGIITAALGDKRHAILQVYLLLTAEKFRLTVDLMLDEYGFITTHGRYVNRIEAKIIARKANQLKPDAGTFKELISEELKYE